MYRIKLIYLLLACALGSLFTSCEETAELDEYANWQQRNAAYIDSIAHVAHANADGKWLKILSFKLDSVDVAGNRVEYGTEDYVYCHIEQASADTVRPLYTDLVSVNYRGRLIPTATYPRGHVFDESYKGDLNPAINVPRNFSVDELIVGWSTALMRMAEGDTWRVYIPAELGYGTQKKGDIPAYSTLIFDMNLVDIID